MAQNITLTGITLAATLTLDTAHISDFVAWCQVHNVPFTFGATPVTLTPTSVAQQPTVAKPERDYSDLGEAKDVELPITVIKGAGSGKLAFALGFGAGREGGKLCIKDAGFAWDESLADGTHKGAWVGTTAQAKALGLTSKSTTLTVPAKWVQAGRDKAAAKAARKASKA